MAERRTSTSKSGGSARKASGSAKSRSSSASRSTKRSAAAKKGGQARGRQQTAQKRAAQTAAAATKPAELSGKSVADLRNALTRGVIAPLNLVMLTRADRARRATGVGPVFPIIGYDDLTVSQVQSRLGDLTPPELRKVRDYEKRHANRKTVLADIELRLGS